MKIRALVNMIGLMGILSFMGCGALCPSPDKTLSSHRIFEADWIRNGEPIEIERDTWYPSDNVENILDSEVEEIGQYRDIKIFVEATDVRPFNRVYTKFGKNKYRYFEKRTNP